MNKLLSIKILPVPQPELIPEALQIMLEDSIKDPVVICWKFNRRSYQIVISPLIEA
jgi:hypothetical protein